MKVILIDPFLRDLGGHHYFYATSIQHELDKRGITVHILGNRQANETCRAIPHFHPVMTEVTHTAFASTGISLKLPFAVHKEIRRFRENIEEALLSNPQLTLEQGDIVFIPTVYAFELIPLAQFFKKHRKRFSQVRVDILLRFRYIRESWALTKILGLIHKRYCGSIAGSLDGQFVCSTDSELLQREYEALLKRQCFVYPIPLAFSSGAAGDAVLSNTPALRKRIVVSYLGAARYNKGFDLFVDSIEVMSGNADFQSKVMFDLQLYVQQQPYFDMQKVLAAVKKLEDMESKATNISVVKGTLSTEQYNEHLEKSDIIVIPYRGEAFKSATSNVFVEAVVFGKIPIVSSGTWMAHELIKNNLEDFVFEAENKEEFALKIRNAVNQWEQSSNKVKLMQMHYRRYHTAENLVNHLLERGKNGA
jgi:glycosyltransferase involved in cell wall biosynthesis